MEFSEKAKDINYLKLDGQIWVEAWRRRVRWQSTVQYSSPLRTQSYEGNRTVIIRNARNGKIIPKRARIHRRWVSFIHFIVWKLNVALLKLQNRHYFISHTKKKISTAACNPIPLALKGHCPTSSLLLHALWWRELGPLVLQADKKWLCILWYVHFAFQVGKNIQLCLLYFK